MRLTLSLHRGSRGPEAGRLGRVLFVSGAGLLSFSAVCLLRSSGPYLEIQNTTLFLFATAVILILSGEMIRLAGRGREPAPKTDWLSNLWPRRGPSTRVAHILRESRCSFCGKSDAAGLASRRVERKSAEDPNAFGRCLNCGRTVCPRCAYLKGMEMGRTSLRCPGCGGQVY